MLGMPYYNSGIDLSVVEINRLSGPLRKPGPVCRDGMIRSINQPETIYLHNIRPSFDRRWALLWIKSESQLLQIT